MVHSHQLFSQPKTIAIVNRINWIVLYPMDAFIPVFCDFVYKHMWMNCNRNRNSLEKSLCDSSVMEYSHWLFLNLNYCDYDSYKLGCTVPYGCL